MEGGINICSQKSLHSLVLCDTELPDQLPQSQTSKFQRMDPERISRGLVLLEPKFSNITPSRPFASEMIPLGKECLRKKTLWRMMKLRRYQERWGRRARCITRESKDFECFPVRNSLSSTKFVFGILLCIVICDFCQLSLPALKMTLDGWKLVSNKHLQSKSLHSLVLSFTELPDQLYP